MKTVSITESSLTSLVELVEQGEEVAIARDGKIVAELIQPRNTRDDERARRAAEALIAYGQNRTLEGVSVKELIEDGRM